MTAAFRMPASGVFGIAYTSFGIRMRQAREANTNPALPAENFIDLCRSFGGDGCQMDMAQLSSTEGEYLKKIRGSLEEQQMFLELSISSRALEDTDSFTRAAVTAQALGASRLRVALLNGRRYEDFAEMKKWKDFVDHSRSLLQLAETVARKHRLLLAIENHKDWLAEELAEILRRTSSPCLGACVDFGNNLALLEDSLEVAEKLAPYVVTTHLKDMALRPYDLGFELSEVPLGQGILPLGRILEVLRKGRSDVHFCLEMITRDPLKVPYLEDRYWSTYEKRDPARIEKFKSSVLSRSWVKPLPRVSSMSKDRMLAAEDENIRECVRYARGALGL